MAGDWLKMRHDLADDPAVIRIATACGLEEDTVVGKLHRLWSWVDRHTTDGHAEGVGLAWVDRHVRRDGFAVEMVKVGWLEETGQGLAFPRFDRHCSDTAKARALTKNRVGRHRNAASVTGALQERYQRREEYPPPPHACASGAPGPEPEPEQAAWETLRAAWRNGPGAPWTPPGPPDEAVARLAEPGWLESALEAIGRLRGCRYFETPVGLPQFCGQRFVKRVLEGRYDDVNPKRNARGADDRRPVRIDPTVERATKAAAAREAARREAEHRRLDAAAVDEIEDARKTFLANLKVPT